MRRKRRSRMERPTRHRPSRPQTRRRGEHPGGRFGASRTHVRLLDAHVRASHAYARGAPGRFEFLCPFVGESLRSPPSPHVPARAVGCQKQGDGAMHPHTPAARRQRRGFVPIITAIVCVALGTTEALRGAPLPYQFTIDPSSGLTTTSASVAAKTSGTLIGNWDATANPTGTRTKPGLFGTFGDTENVAVPATISFATSGAPSVPLGGGFRMAIDGGALSVELTDYASSMSAPATGALATNATITTQSFRTRNPSSTFPGGIPVTIPLGDATITSLALTQTSPATGVLTPAGPNQYTFTIAPTMDVSLGVNLSGSDLALGPVSIVLPMQGTLTLSGDGQTATLTSLAPVQVNDVQNPALVLPPLPFALPTVLPTGGTANVIFNLTLDQVTTLINGNVSTNAAGTLVPAPASGGAIVLLSLIVSVRRRRPPRHDQATNQ